MDKPLWGLRVLKFDGAIAPRVLKFDSGYAAEGCGGRLILLKAPSYDKTFTTGLSPVGKQTDPAPQAWLYGFPLQNVYHAIWY